MLVKFSSGYAIDSFVLGHVYLIRSRRTRSSCLRQLKIYLRIQLMSFSSGYAIYSFVLGYIYLICSRRTRSSCLRQLKIYLRIQLMSSGIYKLIVQKFMSP
jgi:hypothetical protein